MITTPVSLLQRLGSPDEQAWRQFVRLYTPLLYAWAASSGWQSADLDDLVQDVLAAVSQHIGRFQHEQQGSFRCWLKTITLNRYRELRRKRACRPQETHLCADGPEAPELEAFWENDYRKYLVARALGVMRSDFQEVTWRACWMQVVEDRAPAEVAAELQMSVASVYSARSRVLRRLRETLEGMLD